MTPETVQTVFLRVGTSLKEGLATEQRAGGFGLAKLAFLFAGKQVTLQTIRNGRETLMRATGQELLSASAKLFVRQASLPNGTTIEIILPDKVQSPAGDSRYVIFPKMIESVTILKKPLLGKVHVRVGIEGTPLVRLASGHGYDYGRTPLTASIQTDWGAIDIYMSPYPLPENECHKVVLSAGLHQFSNPGLASLPYSVLMNVKPSVTADAPNYPFAKQREGWNFAVLPDVNAVNTIVEKLVFIKETAKWEEFFANLQVFDKDTSTNGIDIYNLVPARSFIKRAAQQPATILQFSVKNGVYLFHNNKPSLQEVDLIDTNKPVFLSHYNVDPIAELSRRTGYTGQQVTNCLAQLAYTLHNFLDKVLDVPCLNAVRARKPLFGIHFHKNLRGVNLIVPQYAIFISPRRDMGESPLALAHGWVHTAMHESAHWVGRTHDATFVSTMGNLYSILEDIHPRLYTQTMERLEQVAGKHTALFRAIREMNNDPSIQNVEYGTTQRGSNPKFGTPLPG